MPIFLLEEKQSQGHLSTRKLPKKHTCDAVENVTLASLASIYKNTPPDSTF